MAPDEKRDRETAAVYDDVMAALLRLDTRRRAEVLIVAFQRCSALDPNFCDRMAMLTTYLRDVAEAVKRGVS